MLNIPKARFVCCQKDKRDFFFTPVVCSKACKELYSGFFTGSPENGVHSEVSSHLNGNRNLNTPDTLPQLYTFTGSGGLTWLLDNLASQLCQENCSYSAEFKNFFYCDITYL